MMSESGIAICRSEELVDGGKGVRFTVRDSLAAFAIRFAGTARAYVNRCPHLGTELDWQPGEFFTEGSAHLICSTHGALFQPHNGFCIEGPCRGASLQEVPLRERNGRILFYNDAPALPDKETDRNP